MKLSNYTKHNLCLTTPNYYVRGGCIAANEAAYPSQGKAQDVVNIIR